MIYHAFAHLFALRKIIYFPKHEENGDWEPDAYKDYSSGLLRCTDFYQ